MRKILLTTMLCISSMLYAQKQKECLPIELNCEHLVNPLGVDKLNPRLSWRLADKRQGAKQSAYQILVSSDSLALVKNKANIVSSWKVKGNKVEYTVEIPANATATFYPPENIRNNKAVQLEAGKYQMDLELK